ncbi:precorrin-3B synthase [Pseudomonas sp. JUb42]|jgi:precorrin-3B synthase|uniref:precorrin-3B synthase n=1 Tax=Pseudomonas sp. JUb42 TaxID=2940611 RepID=UPI00286E84B3|nr:precorrin-3B synthase [Pseudomonas sp. JUb42]
MPTPLPGDFLNKPLSPAVSVRPSACPGLLRIVPALDGGICRIKLAGGVIGAAQARAVARAAQDYAGGVIEATNRGNLQIRGIGAEQGALIETLLAAGLGPNNPDSDDVRNLMLSPTAGLDPRMLLDVRPLAAQILAALENTPRLHELSAKFALSLDGGEGVVMLDHPHDLWLSALEVDGEVLLAFGLAGCPARDKPLAAVPLAYGLELVLGVLNWFLDTARPDQSRMRQLLAEVPAERLLSALASMPLRTDADISEWRRPATVTHGHIGVYPQAETGKVAVGGVTPLGRLDPAMLNTIAQLAEEFGDGSLRLTPWQSLLLPNIAACDAQSVLAGLQAAGLLCSADQALARIIACTGSSDCAKGLADTKADARLLAGQLQRSGISRGVHLSACQRSCAAAHLASVTLLAVSPGHYDLYFRDATQPGFGALQARDLTIEAAGAYLIADSRSNTHD